MERITRATARVPLRDWQNPKLKADLSSGTISFPPTDVALTLLVQLCGNLLARDSYPDSGRFVLDQSLTQQPELISDWFRISNNHEFIRGMADEVPGIKFTHLPPRWMREMTPEHVKFGISHDELGIQMADIVAFASRNLVQQDGASRDIWAEVLKSSSSTRLKNAGEEIETIVVASTSYTRESRKRHHLAGRGPKRRFARR